MTPTRIFMTNLTHELNFMVRYATSQNFIQSDLLKVQIVPNILVLLRLQMLMLSTWIWRSKRTWDSVVTTWAYHGTLPCTAKRCSSGKLWSIYPSSSSLTIWLRWSATVPFVSLISKSNSFNKSNHYISRDSIFLLVIRYQNSDMICKNKNLRPKRYAETFIKQIL